MDLQSGRVDSRPSVGGFKGVQYRGIRCPWQGDLVIIAGSCAIARVSSVTRMAQVELISRRVDSPYRAWPGAGSSTPARGVARCPE